MAITPEQWKLLQQRLECGLFGEALLQCDEYTIRLHRMRLKGLKQTIGVFVKQENEYVFKGMWVFEDCDQRRRFFRPVTKFVFPKKFRDQCAKHNRQAKRYKMNDQTVFDHDKKVTFYVCDWPRFAALKKHLIANNKEITWLNP
jgi:hypothetical protein